MTNETLYKKRLVDEAAKEIPVHARQKFKKDIFDLIRGVREPSLLDYEQAISMSLDLARRRGAP